MGPIACVRPLGGRRGTEVPPTCHRKAVGRVEGCDVLPDRDPWGPLQSPKCKKRVPNSHPQVVVDYYGPFPGRYIRLFRNHAFLVASFDT